MLKKETVLMMGAAALSALLLWAVFPPMGEVCAVVFALTPLLVLSRLSSERKSAAMWFLGGFLFWFGTLSWMPAISKNNGPLPLVILGWTGLAAICAAYFAVFGWLNARAWRRLGKWALVTEPILWVGLEWLRGWLFTGFAWNFLGTAVGQIPSLAAPARLGGVYLVSALVVLVNGVFATLVCRMLAQMVPEPVAGLQVSGSRLCFAERLDAWRLGSVGRWRRMFETAVPLGGVLLCFWLANASRHQSGDVVPVRVALVQRNAPCVFSQRDREEDPYETFGNLLTTATVARPDLVVWAESAMAEFGHLGSDGARHAALYFSRMTGGASLLAGGDWWYQVDAEKGAERRCWNGAGLYTPTSTNVQIQVYGKQHLVPFGEFIPFDKWIPVLQKLSPIGLSIWPGEAKTLKLRLNRPDGASVLIAPLICFEDTDPSLARKAARLGAQTIVLITNDSWFSHSQETVQHAWQSVLRAIETGIPVIRVGNSGVTGIIYPSGRTRWLEDGDGQRLVDSPGTMVETVPVAANPTLTPYSRVGDLPLLLLFAASLLAVFLVKSRP